jgi:hypothetical protein
MATSLADLLPGVPWGALAAAAADPLTESLYIPHAPMARVERAWPLGPVWVPSSGNDQSRITRAVNTLRLAADIVEAAPFRIGAVEVSVPASPIPAGVLLRRLDLPVEAARGFDWPFLASGTSAAAIAVVRDAVSRGDGVLVTGGGHFMLGHLACAVPASSRIAVIGDRRGHLPTATLDREPVIERLVDASMPWESAFADAAAAACDVLVIDKARTWATGLAVVHAASGIRQTSLIASAFGSSAEGGITSVVRAMEQADDLRGYSPALLDEIARTAFPLVVEVVLVPDAQMPFDTGYAVSGIVRVRKDGFEDVWRR